MHVLWYSSSCHVLNTKFSIVIHCLIELLTDKPSRLSPEEEPAVAPAGGRVFEFHAAVPIGILVGGIQKLGDPNPQHPPPGGEIFDWGGFWLGYSSGDAARVFLQHLVGCRVFLVGGGIVGTRIWLGRVRGFGRG